MKSAWAVLAASVALRRPGTGDPRAGIVRRSTAIGVALTRGATGPQPKGAIP
ncbi:hypothetical protein Rumeso_01471 [Rubellimicrobium mesophilum DSM 19309]|uniref:Uncharacterized protein n=1 Tax=Rubellimicrobium mesophilum DSM 19309 TaxID=442562 RepID=A0A017HT69_9RHOB|nr:hypothetical protein Rumeso_01471 [Rubellimicrobium mesophilum DSM 19309]